MLGLVISTRERVFGLDLLRAVAIVCVVHGHGKHFLYGTRMEWLAQLPLPHGVDLFFVLSGFLIGLSVMKMLERPRFGTQTWRFYGKTALRILPNYYAMLLVNLLLVYWGVVNGDLGAKPLYRFATLTQNVASPFVDFYWESWSVPIQWWFYIVFPLAAFLLSRVAKRWALPLTVLLALVGSAAYRLSMLPEVTDAFHYDIAIRKTLAARTDSIYVGVLAAWLCRECPAFWQHCRWWMLGAGLLLFAAVKAVGAPASGFYAVVVLPILVPLAVGMTLPALDAWRTARGKVAQGVMALSILSYAMFMVNLIMAELVDCRMADFAAAHGVAAYLLFWAMVVAGTAVLYYAVERPAMLVRQKVKSRESRINS